MDAISFCIICGKNIEYNINEPFCQDCSSDSKMTKIKDCVNGSFCHSCGKKTPVTNHYPECKICEESDRHTNFIDEAYLLKLQNYKHMPLSEREKIIPRWKIKTLSPAQVYLPHIEVKIVDVLNQLNLNTTDVFSNEVKDNKKTMNILKVWQKGSCVDPPSAIDKEPIVILDGRHRILAAHFLKAEVIPIKLHNSNSR